MNIAIIGQGGHSKVITDLVRLNNDHVIIGYFDDKYEKLTIVNNTYFGPIQLAKKLLNYFKDIKFLIAVGDNKTRNLLAQNLGLSEEYYISLIHPSAIISPSAKIGHGTVIMANSVVHAGTEIGNHSIINTCAVVEHDNRLGDFVHISPNATLTGAVLVEEGVHIGAGANIIPNMTIGKWAVIGAGSTVIKNIPSHCTAVGIPAKVKMKNVQGGV